MAYTEDIPEKVADIIFDQTVKVANVGLDTGVTLVQSAGVLTRKALENMIKKTQNNKELQKILNIQGEITPAQMDEVSKRLGLQSSTVRVVNSDVKDYETLLRQNQVLYAKMSIKDDNAKMFIFLNRDREKIQNVSAILQANRGLVTEVRPDLYFNSLAPEHVRLVDGLDKAEMELFRHYARYEGLLFTAIKRDDKYALVFESKDEPKARKALLHVGWDLTGYHGRTNREQVEYRLKGRSAVHIAAEEGQRELFIVSKNNPANYMHISSEDFSVYKAGKKVSSVSRSSPDFYARCMATADNMDGGVILDEYQFHPDMQPEELEQLRTIDLHERQYDELMEMDHQNSLIDLVAMKSGMDDEHNATWGLWDPSVSYSEFSGYEYIMDDEEREARAVEFEHFKDAAYYAEKHYNAQDIHLDERNIDFIIQKAEEKRQAQSAQSSKTKDNEKNQSNDQKETEPVF